MNPRTFQATFVDGNIAEFRNNARDHRRAANAIWAIDALAAHIFAWAKANPPDKISASDDTGYREELAGQCEGFRVLRDAAKATLAKNGRRWTEFLIEHETARGWRVLASFNSTEKVQTFLAERPDDEVEIVTG
jgi:hypothetical protein